MFHELLDQGKGSGLKMTERSIIFSADMVRAIKDDRKTMTRRVIKLQPPQDGMITAVGNTWTYRDYNGEYLGPLRCLYGLPGDRLWVGEAHSYNFTGYDRDLDLNYIEVAYRADNSVASRYLDDPAGEDICDRVAQWIEDREVDGNGDNWRPSIHMPRWASRITLVITNIRVERLQEITSTDIMAEGIGDVYKAPEQLRPMFAGLWDNINAARGYSWASNPWVWVIEFQRIQP